MQTKDASPNVAYRLAFIESLRGLAALYVVLGHFVSMVDPAMVSGGTPKSPPWLQTVVAPFLYGHLAVAAFIVLSGFCLQLALFRQGDGRIHDLPRFFARRARRILPAYYACLALSIPVALLVTPIPDREPFRQYLPVTVENVLAHVFLVHNLSPEWMYKINGVLWSIAIEVQLYLLFPLLIRIHRWGGTLALLAITMLLGYGTLVAFDLSLKLYGWYLPLFAFGVITAAWMYRPNVDVGTQTRRTGYAVIALAALVGMVCDMSRYLPFRDGVFGIFIAVSLYWLAMLPHHTIARALSSRPLVWLGTFSYSLYLMHHPIQQVLYVFRPSGFQGPELEFLYLVLVGLPIIILFSFGFGKLFELPFVSSASESRTHPRTRKFIPVELPLRPFETPTLP